jgi:hypothetical protein
MESKKCTKVQDTQKLSISNQAILRTYERGFRINREGDVVHPDNKQIKIRITKGLTTNYKTFTGNYIAGNSKVRSTQVRIHRFLAYQKFGDIVFKSGVLVRHKNNDPMDNSWDNILIGTCIENMNDVLPDNRRAKTKKAQLARRKFSDEEVTSILEDKEKGVPCKHILSKYKINPSSLHMILRRQLYKDNPYWHIRDTQRHKVPKEYL